MAARARELMSGIDFGGFGAGPVPALATPALATVAQAGGAAMGRNLTFAPQFNMPMSFDASMDADAIRQEVREELMEAQERAMAELRSLLHD